ncbi:MAG: VWA domain-containing protein [Myxococcales bacterium]|nr:VWA domain-containing protein [Myxococcales bacterium]
MKTRSARVLWVLLAIVVCGLLAYAYRKYVWLHPEPTMRWVRGDVVYELLHPRRLAAVLLAPWFLVVLGWTLADLPWQQQLLTVLTRIAFVALLALGLARPVRSATSEKIAAVVMVDVSDSVSDEALADAQKVVLELHAKKRPGDVVKVVSFAKRPRLVTGTVGESGGTEDGVATVPVVVRHAPRPEPAAAASAAASTARAAVSLQSGAVSASSEGAGSNLEAALQLAYGLFPPGFLRRAVLVTDGVETDGDVLAEANRAKDYGVRLHTVPYRREAPGEVAVRELVLPERVKVGEPFAVKATIYATRATRARARLYQAETLNGLDGVRALELQPGDNEVSFNSVVRLPGEMTYRLELDELPVDRFRENNHVATTVDVPGRPQVLYVEGAPQHAGPLSRALTAQQFDVDVRPVVGFPGSLQELERYDFLVVSDVAKEQLGISAQSLIEQYVRDLGGGFLFAGGENGYGLGGWGNTTIERLLPVRMDAEKINKTPSVAMVLVVDHSGSMSGLPMEMAKAAAKATVDVLAPDDVISVVVFDQSPDTVVKMQPARNRARIKNLIAQVQPAGGTEIFSALDRAYNIMNVTEARKKHVILLTDGRAPTSGIRELVTQMIAESITVTSVGVGGDVDLQLLKMIADVGGGRFHEVPDPNSLPRIFTKETEMISRQAAVEEWFPVVQTGNATFLKRIDTRTAPLLHGYVSTKLKPPPAVELLACADTDEPILARWRVGTGWALAWTSDVKTRWAVEWTTWAGWEKFWGQLVHEHMRQKDRRELDMRAELRGTVLVASVDAFTADERFDDKLVSRLTVLGPLPGGDKTVVPMRQTAPGRYECELPLERYGSFLLRAEHTREKEDGTFRPVATSTGHVSNPYPREYASFKTDTQTLERVALATLGTFEPADLAVAFAPEGEKITYHEELWARAVMAAVAVFLLDLLLRRVRLFDRRFGAPKKRTGPASVRPAA